MATPRERKNRRKPTATEAALAAAKKRREEEAKARAAIPKQPEMNPSTNDVYEQKARDEGWTDPEAIKYWAAKYRAEAEQKATKAAAPGLSMNLAANRVTQAAKGMVAEHAREQADTLANPALYGRGGIRDSDIKARLVAIQNALEDARTGGLNAQLRKTANAVFMGYKDARIRRQLPGDYEFEGGQYRIPPTVKIDNVVSKDLALAFLSDEARFNDIKARMNKAGIDVQSYDDVAKLWGSVVAQAAATYSLTGKKVTPFALIELRGKHMGPGGRPAVKTGVSTTIEEMDPAQARLVLEQAVQDKLGRRPTQAEIEDFVSKAQMIARQNPLVQTWRTQTGFDEQPVQNSFEVTSKKGGAEAVAAKARIAAEDMAMHDEDYGKVQAAGFYMPLLMDALRSPTD